jgi:hypothetical protein
MSISEWYSLLNQAGGGGGTRNPQQKAIPFCLVSAAIQFAEIYFQEDWELKK